MTTEPDWTELATRLRPFVLKRVPSLTDAEDVSQDVMLKMHRALPSLNDSELVSAWMYKIARRSIADFWRDKARHPISQAEATIEEPEEVEEENNASKEMATYLEFFVSVLEEPYREAIRLTELQGMTHKQAADHVGVSLPAMKSRVARGRKKLRQLIEKCCEIALDSRGKVLEYSPRSMGNCKCD